MLGRLPSGHAMPDSSIFVVRSRDVPAERVILMDVRRRIAFGIVVAGSLVALAAVSGADIVSKGPDGTVAVAPSRTPDSTQPARPARPAQPAQPGDPAASDPTDELQRNLGDIAQGLDADERRDLERDIEEALTDVEIDIDELDADLEEQADTLSDIDHENGVEGSKELEAAEARLESLTDELKGLDVRVSDIGRRARAALRDNESAGELKALIADARALGADLDAFDGKIDALETLVSAAEDQQRDRDSSRR